MEEVTMQGMTFCDAYPWACEPLWFTFVRGYLLSLIVFLLVALIVALVVRFILRKRGKIIKFSNLFIGIFLFTVFASTSLGVLRILSVTGLDIDRGLLICALRKAPDECYEFEAIFAIKIESLENPNYEQAHKICNLASDSNTCKIQVCDNLYIQNVNYAYKNPEKSKEVKQQCRGKVEKVCPDGNILENIPCACDYLAGPYAVFDEEWLKNYWNKYRKGDPPIYCCEGRISETSCK